jgi:hypothetical protein
MADTTTNPPVSAQLSPEELEALTAQVATEQEERDAEVVRNTPPSGNNMGYADDMYWRSIDRMETPIHESEVGNPIIEQVVRTPEFLALETSGQRSAMIRDAISAHNKTQYESRGEQSLGGNDNPYNIGFSVRTEQMTRPIENPDFDPDQPEGPDNQRVINQTENFIVPKPGAESTGMQRNFMGGILKGAREIGSFVEAGTDYLGITDPETNYVRENFPVYAPEDALDQGIQEVVSILSGGVGGAS